MGRVTNLIESRALFEDLGCTALMWRRQGDDLWPMNMNMDMKSLCLAAACQKGQIQSPVILLWKKPLLAEL